MYTGSMTTVKLSDTGEVVKLLTLGMSPPVDNTKPTTNNTRDVAAAAAGPEKETSNMSVLFFTKLLNCVTAPNVPIWLFGMKRLVPNLICNRSDCQGCGTLSQPFFNCTSSGKLVDDGTARQAKQPAPCYYDDCHATEQLCKAVDSFTPT